MLDINPNDLSITIKGQRVSLLPKEYALLHFLYHNEGLTFSREQLLEGIWGLEDPGERTVDDHIYRLRRKLKDFEFLLKIETVRGLGYRLTSNHGPSKNPLQNEPELSEKYSQLLDQYWLFGQGDAMGVLIVFYNMMLALLVLMTIQMVDTQLVVLLREQIPGKPNLFGLLISMIGIGALITITLLSRKTSLKSYALLLGLSTFLIGISFTWLSLTNSNTPIIVLYVSAFLAGIGTGLSSIGIQYLLIEKTDDKVFGRITGIYSSLTNLVFIVSPILGGILVMKIGVSFTFRLIGVSLLGIGLVRYIGGLYVEHRERKINPLHHL